MILINKYIRYIWTTLFLMEKVYIVINLSILIIINILVKMNSSNHIEELCSSQMIKVFGEIVSNVLGQTQ